MRLENPSALNQPLARRSPPTSAFRKLGWDAFYAGYLSMAALTFALVASGSHPLAARLGGIGFVGFAVLDYLLGRWVSRTRRVGLARVRTAWAAAGLIGILFTYAWLIRNSSTEVMASLWPLPLFAVYFLIRISRLPHYFYFFILLAVLMSGGSAALIRALAPEADLILVIANSLWLGLAVASVGFHLRKWDDVMVRFDAFRELVRWAGGLDARLEDVQRQLDSLGQRLNLERLSVLRIFRPAGSRSNGDEPGAGKDEGATPLQVAIIARHMPEAAPDETIPPWPLNRGLLAKAYRERTAQVCPDTRLPEWRAVYYNPPGATAYRDTRSEIAQPVYDSPDGQIIGFVDLQSRMAGAQWGHEEIDYVAALAGAIAPLMVKERLGRLLVEMDALRNGLARQMDEEGIFDCLAEFAIEQLDVDVVTYYRLGFGSGWPILPVWHRGSWHPEELQGGFTRDALHPAVRLVSGWDPVYARDSRGDARLLPPGAEATRGDYFISREDVRSTAFLPIGSRVRRIGALFLNYRAPQTFSPSNRLALEMLRQTAAPHLERARHDDDTYRGFGQINLVLHDLVRDSTATNTAIVRPLHLLHAAIQGGDLPAAEQHYAAVLQRLLDHTDYIQNASLKLNLRAAKLLPGGLGLALSAAAGLISEMYSGCILTRDVEPPVERLPADMLLAIFSLVTEAAHNAARYGDADRIRAAVRRSPQRVEVTVSSNSDPWDPRASRQPQSRYGVFARLDLAGSRMAATHRWASDGRDLHVDIPILPLIEGREPYA